MSLRVAVIGLGSMGSRHRKILRELGCEVVGVRRSPAEDELGSLDEAEAWSPDAVVIATPTSEHLAALRWAVERRVHAYVEKPIADSPEGVADLLSVAERSGVVVATGYNLRFHPALETIASAVAAGRIGKLLSVRAEVGQYLPDWHPEEDYRNSYAARADRGGGALLTLSHELDYVRWVAGEVVTCAGLATRTSTLEIALDDVAEVVCTHASGAVSSIHMDLVDRSYNRRSRWVGADASLAWEWGGPVMLRPEGEILWEHPGFDAHETYRAALADFLACLHTRGGRPRADGHDGLRVLELCSEVTRAHS